MSDSARPEATSAGFTLIEVLVALSIVATALSSIGALIATSVRGTRSMEEHFIRLETARGIVTALPDRDQLAPGVLAGETSGHPWRLEVSPFVASNFAIRPGSPWSLQRIAVTVRSPSGGSIQVNTVRLHRRDAK